jgi:hypothetical protein
MTLTIAFGLQMQATIVSLLTRLCYHRHMHIVRFLNPVIFFKTSMEYQKYG